MFQNKLELIIEEARYQCRLKRSKAKGVLESKDRVKIGDILDAIDVREISVAREALLNNQLIISGLTSIEQQKFSRN